MLHEWHGRNRQGTLWRNVVSGGIHAVEFEYIGGYVALHDITYTLCKLDGPVPPHTTKVDERPVFIKNHHLWWLCQLWRMIMYHW
jgi:hypothetical protein